MTVQAYYNEIDPYAAQWLRNLIEAGHIAPGYVDERSIEDVRPVDLLGYTQCHFFAGVGVWSLALRRAGWPDSRPIWTGSCPCQPFSSAGKRAGFDDERHLWPAFYHLIAECKPESIFGEQVASAAVNPWIDLVHTDLEAVGYAFGCVPFPSASVGAPHIRDRAYWMADSKLHGYGGTPRVKTVKNCDKSDERLSDGNCTFVRLDDAVGSGLERFAGNDCATRRQGSNRSITPPRSFGGLGHSDVPQLIGVRTSSGEQSLRDERDISVRELDGRGPTNGFWQTADWLYCRDAKWRPVEPGTFPLANGVANRMGRLRAYGNAINAYQAQIFIESYLDV